MLNHIKTIPCLYWIKWYLQTKLLYLKNIGKNIKIYKGVKIEKSIISTYNTFYPNVHIYKSNIGEFVYVADETIIINTDIGKFCSIGPRVRIGLGIHPTDHVSTFPAFFSTRKQCIISFCNTDLSTEYKRATIGNDVWIGANVIILDGVNIGDGAIIAAGAVVAHDVEAYTIVGGVPAKAIKKRFDNETITQLLTIKWWNNDLTWIKENAQFFDDISCFLKKTNN